MKLQMDILQKKKSRDLDTYSMSSSISKPESQTSISQVYNVDSSVPRRAASILNPGGHCYSCQGLSDDSLLFVEWMPQFHRTRM